MKRFEYLTINKYIDSKELNMIGENGWELVSHVLSVFTVNKTKEYYIFKREIKFNKL